MRSFLLKNKKPIIKWGMLPDNVFFEGEVPEGFSLAVSPSRNYIVIDVDTHGDINGFDNLPHLIQMELSKSLTYPTKNDGRHYWMIYTGSKELANKTSGLGIDLRTNKGYAVWYKKEDIRECLHLIKPTSEKLNKWLEKLFSYCIDKN
jgi:hypothetical protein